MMQNKVILCLGSNQDCESNMSSAGELLRRYFCRISFSDPVYTDPVGLSGSGQFLNQVAVAYTDCRPEEVRLALKTMERTLGRTEERKEKGQIPIDIDLLLWNDEILKPADWAREYIQLLYRSVLDCC